ncbi:MAG: hypothetical protein OHK0022_52790 [Roseiflexaceae bacterium]
MTQQPAPSMDTWQRAWANGDAELLRQTYADDARVFPPNRAVLRGPAAIVEFFSGGFNSVEVRFFRESLAVADTLAFETGTVKDTDRATGRVVEVCDYAITWTLRDGAWNICLHTWSVPKDEA